MSRQESFMPNMSVTTVGFQRRTSSSKRPMAAPALSPATPAL